MSGLISWRICNLLKCSSYLKRLVLIDRPSDDSQRKNVSPSFETENFLFSFVSDMENPVALCFTSYRIHSQVFNRVTGRVVEEVVPLRPPSFWFHLGQTLLEENDPAVPRISIRMKSFIPLNGLIVLPNLITWSSWYIFHRKCVTRNWTDFESDSY